MKCTTGVINLFIDTNVFLTFYSYSSDDLEELKKLTAAIKSKKVKLHVTQQVIDEYNRNREAKIQDALKRLREQKVPKEFPQLIKGYKEYEDLKQATKHFEINKDKILTQVTKDTKSKRLRADQIIAELFAQANMRPVTQATLDKAKTRMGLGNPPGKDNSLGDAINWELLLEHVPNKEDFYLVTDDRDYISKIDNNALAQFLIDEWEEKKESKITFYRRLSQFFGDQFPGIKLATEMEKVDAIAQLANSASFADTHVAIARLAMYTEFSDQEIKDLVDASVKNNQIYWISNDPDVYQFFTTLVKGKEDLIDPEKLEEFHQLFAVEEDEKENAC